MLWIGSYGPLSLFLVFFFFWFFWELTGDPRIGLRASGEIVKGFVIKK